MMASSTVIWALMFGAGIFLFIQSLGARKLRVRLTQEDQRPALERMVESLFAPAAKRVLTAGKVDLGEHERALAMRLARAGYPQMFTSPDAVIGYRLFSAVIFAAMGGLFGLVISMGVLTLAIMGILAAMGWAMPDRVIANAERDRREQLTLDAASTLDRLAIYVAAGNALPAAITSVSRKPGGAWVVLFRRVAALYHTEGDFKMVIERVIEENGRLPDIARVLDRLVAAYDMGGGRVAEGLRRMAGDARIRIRLLITERGHRNSILMVIPAFFAIVAMTIVLIGPGISRLTLMLAP